MPEEGARQSAWPTSRHTGRVTSDLEETQSQPLRLRPWSRGGSRFPSLQTVHCFLFKVIQKRQDLHPCSKPAYPVTSAKDAAKPAHTYFTAEMPLGHGAPAPGPSAQGSEPGSVRTHSGRQARLIGAPEAPDTRGTSAGGPAPLPCPARCLKARRPPCTERVGSSRADAARGASAPSWERGHSRSSGRERLLEGSPPTRRPGSVSNSPRGKGLGPWGRGFQRWAGLRPVREASLCWVTVPGNESGLVGGTTSGGGNSLLGGFTSITSGGRGFSLGISNPREWNSGQCVGGACLCFRAE